MNDSYILQRSILLLAICWAGLSDPCLAQQRPTPTIKKSPKLESEAERKRVQRREFQAQQIITAKRNGWILKLGEPPRMVWRDVETVRRLGFKGPLRIRWFDAELNEAAVPNEPGRWAALVEGTAPNGTSFRRAMTFYAPSKGSFIFWAPEIKISFPHMPPSVAASVWREHESELARHSTGLLRSAFADSETSAVVMAGFAELKPRGRPARFVESVDVLDEDYHLSLKLKVHGLQNSVRPLQPPRRRAMPATILHQGSPCAAGMLPDARAKIDAVCRAWAEESGEPFVTLVARRGVVITHEAFGTDKSDKRIDREYRCWVASITKSVTAILFSRFLDQGLIKLDDSVATVFPDYPKNDPHVPTFRQCFNHTSGLTGHGAFGGFRNTHLENVVLNGIDVNEPNARYAYSGLGFDLAVKAMEIVAGRSGVRLYDEHLFRPLNLGDVPIHNGSSDGHFTAMELGILGQWVSNRGSYGNLEFISPRTFASLLPEPLDIRQETTTREEGIGLHWVRHAKPGAPRNSKRPQDQLFSPTTVGYGSFSGCIFMVDLEQDLVVVQVRRRTSPRWRVWSARFFQAIAEAVKHD